MRPLHVLPLLLLLAACDSNDLSDRTYPVPGSHTEVALDALTTAAPGTYNTEGVVTSIFECPEGTTCIIPDNFTLAPPLNASPDVLIYADTPSQLAVGGRYRMSIQVVAGPSRTYRLVGYERLD